MSVQGVTTTGIYCVPSCSARPLPGHVVPYRSAGRGGGRRLPRLPAVPSPPPRPRRSITGPELVCRAVHLITEGALDGRPEARPGDGARRVGPPPPPAVRRARRHHARPARPQPPQPTSPAGCSRTPTCPVTDIAWASGFGSLRQLNRASQQVFHAPPTRAAGPPPPRRSAPGRRRAHAAAPVPRPLDWDALLDYFADPRDRRGRARRGRHLPPHDRGRRPPGRPRAQPGRGRAPAPPRPPGGRPRAHPRRASGPGRSSPSTAIPTEANDHLASDPRFAPSVAAPARASACPARGIRTRPACAPSSASR